jgi:hypothetical protein
MTLASEQFEKQCKKRKKTPPSFQPQPTTTQATKSESAEIKDI